MLFSILCEKRKFISLPLNAVVHFNFGLRGKESDEDESFVRRMTLGAKLNFLSFRFYPNFSGKTEVSVQEWARKMRLNTYRKLAKQGQLVCLGHHLDDQAETTLFRMARGTSPARMLGMRRLEGGIWRPLLHLTKSEIDEFATVRALTHRFDQSNATMKYSRNRIRRAAMPILQETNSNAAQHLVDCANDAEQLANFFRGMIKADIKSENQDSLVMSLQWFDAQRYPDAVALIAAEEILNKMSPCHHKRREVYFDLVKKVRLLTATRGGNTRFGMNLDMLVDETSLRIRTDQMFVQKSGRLGQSISSFEPEECQIVSDGILDTIQIPFLPN